MPFHVMRIHVILYHWFPAGRYHKLTIGLTNDSPWILPPTWLEYAICARYFNPAITVPVNLTIPCIDVGNANRYRYVILQSGWEVPAALCFIEVQVMANGKNAFLPLTSLIIFLFLWCNFCIFVNRFYHIINISVIVPQWPTLTGVMDFLAVLPLFCFGVY